MSHYYNILIRSHAHEFTVHTINKILKHPCVFTECQTSSELCSAFWPKFGFRETMSLWLISSLLCLQMYLWGQKLRIQPGIEWLYIYKSYNKNCMQVWINWSQTCLWMLKNVKLTSEQYYYNNTLKSQSNVQIMRQLHNEVSIKINA
jgi:hypothetical protein